MKKRLIILVTMLLWATILPSLAQVNVKGKVVDEQGAPLVGVSLRSEVGSKAVGTTTDLDGNYVIQANPGSTLEFSFIGFKTQNIPVSGSGVINVTMQEDRRLLDEAVVIGYGTVKKKDILGSVSTVREQSLEDRKSGNVVESLQGLTSGVKVTSSGQPGSSASIQIRGIGSLTGNSPLFIVDGSYGGSELGLNVEDIESIQILKDASSAAIYGSRAASGVVIITTKKGKTGDLKVKFDAQAQLYWLPRYDLMDAETYKVYDDRAYAEAMLQGVSGVTGYQNHYDGNTDWQDEMLKTGILQNYNVSLSGGTDNIKYYTSINYKDDNGALYSTGFSQTGFRINTSGKKKWFEYGENFFYTRSDTKKLNGNPWANFITMPPTINVYDSNHAGGYGYGDPKRANTYALNPVAMQDLMQRDNKEQYMYGDAYAMAHIYKNIFYAKLNFSYKSYFGETNTLRKKGNWTMGQGDDAAYLGYETANHHNLLVENTYNFDYQIAKHSINAVAGLSYDTFHEDYRSETKLDPLIIGDKYIKSFDSATGTQTCTGSYIEYALLSYFGRLNYSYNDRYLLQLTARRDGTSRLPAESRWANFASASIGWRISNEPFFKVSWIDDLKLRANYGTLGNTDIGAWDYQATINTAPRAIMYGDEVVIGKTQSNLTNNDLHWEKKTTANVGVDFLALRKRLSASVEYYSSKSTDLLLSLPVLYTTGNEGGAPMVNAGSLRNTGFEVELGWNDRIGDFNYAVNANFSTVKNKILSLGYGQTVYYNSLAKSEVGHPLGQWYLYKTLGVFQSQDEIDSYVNSKGKVIQPNALPGDIKYDDYDDDGQITSSDRQLVGNPWPKLYSGLSVSLGYKQWDLNINGYGRFGQQIYNGAKATAADFSTNQNNFNGYKPWTQEAPTTNTPRIIYGDTRNSRGDQSRWLEDGSFFRISDISIGYNVPSKFLKTIGLEQLRASVIGKNLLTFTKYTGLDPEFSDGGIYTIGYDGCSFPNPRSVQFSVSLTF